MASVHNCRIASYMCTGHLRLPDVVDSRWNPMRSSWHMSNWKAGQRLVKAMESSRATAQARPESHRPE